MLGMNPRQQDTNMRSLISPVQLAKADRVAGTVFYKQLFSYGTWANPMWWWDGEPTMELTKDMAQKMKTNFDANVVGTQIPVPLNHTDDVTANTGTVMKLEVKDDGLYGYLDIKRPEVVQDINDGLIYDVSMGFDWDYVSQKDSTHYGPTLFHVALVNTPYINNMSGFTEAQLSKRNEEYAAPLQVAGKPSVVMMSLSKVEELKRMTLAKITNDKDHKATVTYTDADGKEVTAEVEPGAEIEVPQTEADKVTQQIESSTAPTDDHEGETDDEKAAREQAEADAQTEADRVAAEEAAKNEPAEGETPEQELARVRAENAELKANEAYSGLLSKHKILPAQKDLFLSFAKLGEVKLSADLKGVTLSKGKFAIDAKGKLSKGQSVGILTMLSAMLEAGPDLIKFGEKGGQGEGGNKVELTKEQEAKIVRMGFNLETFKKQLKAGTITLSEIEEK